MEIAIKLHAKFEPYNRRLDRFKNCSTIIYGTTKSKAQSVDLEVETWNSSILPARIAAYEPRDILTLTLSNKSLVLMVKISMVQSTGRTTLLGSYRPTWIVVNKCLWL